MPIRFLTAGESHGKGLVIIVEGFPAGLKIDIEKIDEQLKRRQGGYGRGLRMKIEQDRVEVISGIRYGKTIGSPISFIISNKDWENWKEIMRHDEPEKAEEKITIPRPGHADLTGVQKYGFNDIRNSIERSSARETAARVAACSVARQFLEAFDISVGSFVDSIGGVENKNDYYNELLSNPHILPTHVRNLTSVADESPVRVLDKKIETKIINRIKKAKKAGDSLGGSFVVIAAGLPAGLGSYMHYDRRLDAEISASIISINAVKAVEIGAGISGAFNSGSQVHDEITLYESTFSRKTNRAGGIEGGISTGLPLILRGYMKPIATLMQPLKSINLKDMSEVESRRERSDFVAVPACAVIAESMVSWVIAKNMLQKFGGDSIHETMRNYNLNKKEQMKLLKSNFR